MKIKEGKASLREVNRGLKMHEQHPRERAATTHEQQPHERAAATRGLDRRSSGSASRSSDLRQREQIQRLAAARADPVACGSARSSSGWTSGRPSSSSDFRQAQQFQQFPANRVSVSVKDLSRSGRSSVSACVLSVLFVCGFLVNSFVINMQLRY